MKKVFICICVLCLCAISINAQTFADTQSQVENPYIHRSGNTYIYQGIAMRGKDYEAFLQKNCTAAYVSYHRGRKLASAGWTCLGLGLSLDVISAAAYIALIAGSKHGNPIDHSTMNTVIALSVVGACFEIACIPTLIVGYHKQHQSEYIFNLQCYKQNEPRAYWSVIASQNGLGIAYNF